MFGSSSKPTTGAAPSFAAPSFAALAVAALISTLAGVGCGENVLVGNWQLRSLGDAGVGIPDGVDAGINPGGAAAQGARNKQRKNDQKDRQSHSNGDKANQDH